MPPSLSTDFKELVRSKTDIVELIGESVTLQPKQGGRQFAGLCPFHEDHNPSLTVSPERQSYKCWSCGEGGDCFSFLMKHESLDFRTALEQLAERAHLDLPKSYLPGKSQSRHEREQLYKILKWAEDQFHNCLLHSREAERARNYLAQRNFSQEIIGRFRLGFHPADWQWLLDRARGKFTPEQLVAARLVRERSDGIGFRDEFVDRVMFPIHDTSGRSVAFGGRILPDNKWPDAPKYFNSPESPLFTKSSLLYGFDVARDAIRKTDSALVVEGYTDCIVMHQQGFENVVGTLGTALTDAHVNLLKRFAKKVVLIYDGDEAGQSAVDRSLAKFLTRKIDLRILTLPTGADPADYLDRHGANDLRQRIDSAVEAWEHKLQLSLARNDNNLDGHDRVLDEMLELIAAVPHTSGNSREDIILNRLAHRLRLSEDRIRRRLSQIRKNNDRRMTGGQGTQRRVDVMQDPQQPGCLSRPRNKYERVEWELLEIIFAAPKSVETIRREVAVDEFSNPGLRSILQLCYDLWERAVAPSYAAVTAALEDVELKRLALSIDEESQTKNVSQKLRDDEPSKTSGEQIRLLQQVLESWNWRRQEQSYEQSKEQTSGPFSATGSLDQDDKALLRRATDFNQRRAQKKATT